MLPSLYRPNKSWVSGMVSFDTVPTPCVAVGDESPAMELDGRSDMTLASVAINGEVVDGSEYELTPEKLILKACPPGEFELKITTTIKPHENTQLEGLYKSGGNYCTQVSTHTSPSV
jgi:aminopeptidase N